MVKDYVSEVEDRILGKTNPGNIMIAMTDEGVIDTSQRLILIDNVFAFYFQKSIFVNKTKMQTRTVIREQVEKFLLESCSKLNKVELYDTSKLYDNIYKGIKQGLKELRVYLKNTSVMAEPHYAKYQTRVIKNIQLLLKKME